MTKAESRAGEDEADPGKRTGKRVPAQKPRAGPEETARETHMKNNLIFIGMLAVGKSTVGIVVAKRLGMNFIDADLLIQEQEKKLLREIIAEVGQDGFLKIENQVNAELETENSVISPGGSVIYCKDAMKHYKEIGTIVYLKASYQTIKKRIHNPKKRGVVLRKGQSFRDLYNERVPYFEKYADITVCEDGCRIEDTIENVLNAVAEYRRQQKKQKKKKYRKNYGAKCRKSTKHTGKRTEDAKQQKKLDT